MAQPATNPKIEELRFRLKADPKSRLFYPLAEELRKAGQTGEAEQVLRTGLVAHPTYLSAWVSLGRVLRDLKKDGDAVEPLSKALQLDPGNVVAARLLADAYLNLGEKLEAIKKYKLVHALLPSDQDLAALIQQLDRELHPPEPVAPEPEPVAPEPEPEAPSAEAAPAAEPIADEPSAPDESPFASAVAEPEAEAAAAPQDDVAPAAPFGAETSSWESDITAPAAPGGAAAAPAAAAVAGEPFVAEASTWESDIAAPAPPVAEPVAEEPFASEAASWESDLATPAPQDDVLAPRDEEPSPLATAIATADIEPMRVAHEESPFEEPVPSYTSAAMGIEAPLGFHIDPAPVSAEVPAPVIEEEEADVFAPAPMESEAEADEPFAPEPSAEPVQEDLTNTLTMADLYARQGAISEARHIYESILVRDPQNDDVRNRLAALLAPAPPQPGRNPKIARLENWLARVSRKEAGRV